MPLIILVVHFFNRAAKSKQRDDIRDNHHGVKAVCHVPYKIYLRQRAKQNAHSNQDGINLDCFRAEQILHIRLAEEIPAKNCTEREEEHTDRDKDVAALAVKRRECILAQFRAGLAAWD